MTGLFLRQSESCMCIVSVCSRKTKGGGEGCSKWHSYHWQWHISATKKKKSELEALMHLFLYQLQFTFGLFLAFLVCFWFCFSWELVPAFCKCAKL